MEEISSLVSDAMLADHAFSLALIFWAMAPLWLSHRFGLLFESSPFFSCWLPSLYVPAKCLEMPNLFLVLLLNSFLLTGAKQAIACHACCLVSRVRIGSSSSSEGWDEYMDILDYVTSRHKLHQVEVIKHHPHFS